MAEAKCSLQRHARPVNRPLPHPSGPKLRQFCGSVGLLLLSASLGATLVSPPRPILLWNASASSPIGLYWLQRSGNLSRGDRAAAWPPDWARRLGSKRQYIPLNVPLVKRVAATAGDRICAHRNSVSINGETAAIRRSEDPLGRPMPHWEGCRLLGPGEYFLFDPGKPTAFDGRYFGMTGEAQIIGKAVLLWHAG